MALIGFTFYGAMYPLLAVSVAAGAVAGVLVWRRAGFGGSAGLTFGGVVGAACGALGPLAVMTPLRSCTFEPERTGLDRALGGIFWFAGASIAIALAGWGAFGAARSAGRMEGRADLFAKGQFRRYYVTPWLLLIPTLVILVLFLYRPTIETMRLSLYSVRTGAPRQPFVCLDKYTVLMDPTLEWWALAVLAGAVALSVAAIVMRRTSNDPIHPVPPLLLRLRGILVVVTIWVWAAALFSQSYRPVFMTTSVLTIGTVSISLAAGLAVAMLVSRKIRGRGIYRTMLIWPYAISPPIAGILFNVIFAPRGIFERVFETITPWDLPNYKTDVFLARLVVIMASVWKTMGFSIVFYIAGLQNVPTDTLEASHIDGAGWVQRLRFVTLPALAPITFFLLVSNVTYAFFEVFGTIWYTTEGGPSGGTTDAMTALIRAARTQGNFGDGAAQSMMLFIMVLAVTAWQFRSTGKRVTYNR